MFNKKREDVRIVPRPSQETIPIQRVYSDGIFYRQGQYTKSWRFTDIPYQAASSESQYAMFMSYCALLNSLDTDATTKITIHNRPIDRKGLASLLSLAHRQDGLDHLREEHNRVTLESGMGSNKTIQDRYVTVTTQKRSVEDAKALYNRTQIDLEKGFSLLSSKVTPLSLKERLEALHTFFRGEADPFFFDFSSTMKRGHDFRDAICPQEIEFKGNHFILGNRYGRVLTLVDYASYVPDTMITELCDLDREMLLSIDLAPIPTDEAVKLVERQMLSIDTDIERIQDKQRQNGNYGGYTPYHMTQAQREAKEFLDDLTGRDQRMIFTYVTIVHLADNMKQLNNDTNELIAIGRKRLCRFDTLKYRQEDGLNTALPYGFQFVRRDEMRTLTTESAAVLLPFKSQDIMMKGGKYYGKNIISGNPILVDRDELMVAHGWIFGKSGSGKSMNAKLELVQTILNLKRDLVVIDPEGEFANLISECHGTVLDLSPTSQNYINALEVSKNYGGDADEAIALKSDFILTLCDMIVESTQLNAKERSIVDRCVSLTLGDYCRDFRGENPTLVDLHRILLQQPEREAADIALALEMFTSGSLNIFAKQTNLDMSNGVVCFNLRHLGKHLRSVGEFVVTDYMVNRVSANAESDRRTNIVIDEMQTFFASPSTAATFESAYARFRKYGAQLTAITQNISKCMESPVARTMISNSEFLIMLNQSRTDRDELAALLNISPAQLAYITDSAPGDGLIKVGGSIVPFTNQFPKNTNIYKLITTKPGE